MTTSSLTVEDPIHTATHDSEEPLCCTWCGLPVAGVRAPSPRTLNAATADASASDDVYCCFGCRMAHTITEERGREGAVRWTIVRLGIAIFFSMNLMAFTMTMWSLDVYDVQRDPFQVQLFDVFRWLSMIFSLPVLGLLGIPLLQNAIISWRQHIFSTDLLIATGVASAYMISVVNVLRGSETVFFEVGATVLVMVTLGRWFEATGKHRATEALDQLAALLPESVSRITPDGSEEVPCSEITVGDRMEIRPGERFPVDAILVQGRTTVDEQVFTGESVPVGRVTGDRLLGGTVNLDGNVIVEATAVFKAGSFGRLLQLLEEARLSRGHYQRLADRVSAWFFPLITGVAALTLIAHWSAGIGVAVQHALSVLLIACPCALGLATPLAVWTALSTAAKHQVLFRSGDAIERLAIVKSICFDKTGTLTTGSPQVRHLCVLDDHESRDILPLCATLAKTSTHPFSKAVVQFVEEWPASNRGACNAAETRDWNKSIDLRVVRSVPGGGVEAVSPDGKQLRLGSLEFVTAAGDISPRLRLRMAHALSIADQEAASVVAVSVAARPVIMFLLTETMRPESSETVKRCIEMDLPVTVLTGDRAAKAEQLRRNLLDCHEVGCQCSAECVAGNDHDHHHEIVPAPVPASRLRIECDLRPEQKVRHLREIREHCSTVAMVGDGINDAPALAVSDVGIAMGCGADVSRDSAQVCLLSNDLSRIPWAVQLARRTTRVIRQNLFWAFGYNFAGVVLASFGLLNPAVAAGLMIISSLLVITNSLRLMADTPDDSSEHEQPTTKLNAARSASSNTPEEAAPEWPHHAVLPSPDAKIFDPNSDAAPPRALSERN
jgi:heavy metal translocating P-type ATPase